MSQLQEIKRAITALTPDQREELYAWFDQHCSSLFDARIEADVASGCLDGLVARTPDDERNVTLGPL